jgi:hypothetical protein
VIENSSVSPRKNVSASDRPGQDEAVAVGERLMVLIAAYPHAAGTPAMGPTDATWW